MKQSVTILILAYNEEKNLEDAVYNCSTVAKELFDDYELLICNDGSTDSTGEIAKRLSKENPKIHVFHNKKNMGIGYSYYRGIQLAQREYTMWVPGDNEVKIASIKDMLMHIGDADLIISYIGNPKIRPIYRQIFSAFFIKSMNLLFGLNLKSYLGMILCKTKLIRKLDFTTNSSGLKAEIIIKLIKTGHTYKQVPISMRKKRMSGNIFRPKNIAGLIKTVAKLFIMFQLQKSKDVFK